MSTFPSLKWWMLHPIRSITFLRPRYCIDMLFFINNGWLLLCIGSAPCSFKNHLLGIARRFNLIMKTLRIAFEHLKPYGINQKNTSTLLRNVHYCNYLTLQRTTRSLVLILSRKLRRGFPDQQRRKRLQKILIMVILTQACKNSWLIVEITTFNH